MTQPIQPGDLEMVTRCAQAMGYEVIGRSTHDNATLLVAGESGIGPYVYRPLHDDAQAMALVKRIGMSVYPWNDGWCAERNRVYGDDRDLNRAIVKCVAMQSLGDTLKAEKP